MLVTHGGVINAIYSYATNTNWSNKFSNIKVASSSLFQIDIDKENNKVKQIEIGQYVEIKRTFVWLMELVMNDRFNKYYLEFLDIDKAVKINGVWFIRNN